MATRLSHVSVIVKDQEEALKWYTEKLGFEKRSDDTKTIPGLRWLTVAPSGQKDIEIILQSPDPRMGEERAAEMAKQIGKNPTWVLWTDDCMKAHSQLAARGVTFIVPPKKEAWGLSAVFLDLYGNAYNLLERPAVPEVTSDIRTKMTTEPGGREVMIVQVYDAPREKVFKAFSDPKLIPKWWGPKYLTTTVEKMEARPGGSWRIIQRDPAGNKYGFHGVYHDVTAPTRSVRTSEFEGMPGHASLETSTFEERNGKTVVTTLAVFQTVEDRDAAVNSGMEKGVVESGNRFAELLKGI